MKRALETWKWSLGVVARSYWAVLTLAALTALWLYAAYAWLGLAESSALLLILALVWAIAQILVTVAIAAGIASTAAETAATNCKSLSLSSLWTLERRKILSTCAFCILGLALVGLFVALFYWISQHSVEVASFLSFHWQKPVSYILVDEVFWAIEFLAWVAISGCLLSFLILLMHAGWRAAARQTGRLLSACTFRSPFLTSLLSLVVFGGIAYEVATWHPLVPPEFWDYTQMIARMALALIIAAAGALFWALSLARQILPSQSAHDGRGGLTEAANKP